MLTNTLKISFLHHQRLRNGSFEHMVRKDECLFHWLDMDKVDAKYIQPIDFQEIHFHFHIEVDMKQPEIRRTTMNDALHVTNF